jgi:LPS-assembly lipoprotein
MSRHAAFPKFLAKSLAILALGLALPLGLAACGFHLRNALSLPPDLGPVRVTARDPYSPLADSLAIALENAGATAAADDATTGVATLRIRSEKWGQTPISVDQFGRAQEYTLRYAVVFTLDKADGTNVVPEQVVELARDYISVPTRSTGTESERELLAREMQKEMTASILRRIDAASRAPKPVGELVFPAAAPADAPATTSPIDATPAEEIPAQEVPADGAPEQPATEPATTP